jgi:phosphoserine phosphatase
MTDLVVQSPQPLEPIEKPFAARIGRPAERPSPNALRWSGVAADPSLESLAEEHGADLAWVPADRMLRDHRLVVMDMDSTLIAIECIDEIADMVGVKPQVAAITEAAMRGELDFPSALRRRVALLEGLEEAALQRVYDERLRLSPGAEAMLHGLRSAGLKTLLVSGGFTFFTERLQRRLGLDRAVANVLEIEGGRLTGRVLGEIVDAERKATELRRMCAELGVEPRQAIAIGDGANDLAMMAAAGVGIAFRAKPVVRRQATHSIRFCGLEAVLQFFR